MTEKLIIVEKYCPYELYFCPICGLMLSTPLNLITVPYGHAAGLMNAKWRSISKLVKHLRWSYLRK